MARAIGLDVHLELCEVAIAEDGAVRSAGRVQTKPQDLELFAQSLGPDDRVALEVTGTRRRSRGSSSRTWRASWLFLRAIPGSAKRVRGPTGSTRARWRGCSRRGSWMRCGCPIAPPG